ncbi:MAG: alpha/beta fold hydrolase [Gemmatimonadetes bacterium]|mgnify:CR=1 FL=1|nr:alpha/beta fold hydrolase [Gemmatimonadota bacterium]MBT6144125.1 alpha/beta fold hydrolase [Gemmatimonadota bacterium]MBT7859868.1 alpha/beta fold hydrolase [Gemmatimonadota bacterium]
MPRLRLLIPALLLLAVTAYATMGYLIYDGLSRIGGICADNAANGPGYFECRTDCAGWVDFDFDSYRMPRHEDVLFESRDGLTLSGWYVETDPQAPVVIVVHGYQVCKYHHDPLTVAGALSHVGYNVLLFDQRDCGDSEFEDGRSAYGSEEYLDALGAFDYLIARGFAEDRIGMHGSSLGGTVALIAFAREPRLKALFLDSPLIDARAQFSQYTGLPDLLFPAVEWAAHLVSDDDLLRHDPLEGVHRAAGRALFAVHGTGDSVVRSSHTDRLADVAAASGVDLQVWMPEGIDHVRALPAYPAEYEARLRDYFGQHLNNSRL